MLYPTTPSARWLALTPGDRISGDFDECDDGELVLDGGVDVTFVSFSPSIEACFFDDVCVDEIQLTSDLVLRHLSATEDGETFILNGDARSAIDTLTPPTSIVQVSGHALTAGDGTDSTTVRDYDTLVTSNLDTGDYELETSGRLTSTKFDGEIRYETTQSFLGNGSADPNSGVLQMEGADDATIDLVAQANGVDVDLEIDLDGDGGVDEIQPTTWDELRALL